MLILWLIIKLLMILLLILVAAIKWLLAFLTAFSAIITDFAAGILILIAVLLLITGTIPGIAALEMVVSGVLIAMIPGAGLWVIEGLQIVQENLVDVIISPIVK